MSGPFDFLPNSWSDFERSLYESAFEPVGAFNDTTAQALFNEGYFNFDVSSEDRRAIRAALDDYMESVYGVDFDRVFDWEAWRDAYEEEG